MMMICGSSLWHGFGNFNLLTTLCLQQMYTVRSSRSLRLFRFFLLHLFREPLKSRQLLQRSRVPLVGRFFHPLETFFDVDFTARSTFPGRVAGGDVVAPVVKSAPCAHHVKFKTEIVALFYTLPLNVKSTQHRHCPWFSRLDPLAYVRKYFFSGVWKCCKKKEKEKRMNVR